VSGPRIIAVSGLPGAGKSTTARLLAARLEPAAHVEADELQRMIVSGGVWPDGRREVSPAAAEQLRLRLRNACLLARSFREAGFTAVIDDIVAGPRLHQLLEELAGVPFSFVMLLPDFEIVRERWRAMNSPFVDSFGWIDQEIRERTPRVGLWLDTTELDPEATVEAIVERLDAAGVGI
jgi:predicted kinase